MKKDLPDVFPVPVDKKINNVQDSCYARDEITDTRSSDNLSIESKINRIFNSNDYIYKKKVQIKTRDNILNKTLIGRTENSLLTMDNEKININDIIDIN